MLKIDYKYKTNKCVAVDIVDNVGGYIGLGSRQIEVKDFSKLEHMIDILHIFLEPLTIQEAIKKYNGDESDFYETFTLLKDKNFICENYKFTESRYDRNYIHYMSYGVDPVSTQNKLESSTVVIIGCGGIGNHISAILAGVGVGKIVLVDFDIIELTNLTRQILFTEDDIGLKKTKILKRELSKRNSNIKIEIIDLEIKNIKSLELIPKADIWVLSADEPRNIGKWVHDYCSNKKQAYIRGCYLNDIAVYGPLYIPEKSEEYIFSKKSKNLKLKEKIRKINAAFKVATFPTVNAISAAQCAADIIKYLGNYSTPQSLDKRIGIWSDEEKVHSINLSKAL